MKLSPEVVATILQSAEKEAILERALRTVVTMTGLAPAWQWSGISPGDFDAEMTAIRGPGVSLEDVAQMADYEEGEVGRLQERLLAALHKATVRALAVARVAWAEETERTEVLAPLHAAAQQGPEILEEAEVWEMAWAEVDPAFQPLADLALTDFQAQIAAARNAGTEARRMTVRRQRAQARLAVALHRLNQHSQRWYAVATATFDEDTMEGERIRSSIPTTYEPRYYAAAKRRRAARKAEKAALADAPAPAPAAVETPAS